MISQALAKALGKDSDLPVATSLVLRVSIDTAAPAQRAVFIGTLHVSFRSLCSSLQAPANVLFFPSQLCVLFFLGICYSAVLVFSARLGGVGEMTRGVGRPFLSVSLVARSRFHSCVPVFLPS